MKLTEFFRAELDREVERSRHALKNAPTGKYDWKPHDDSMIFGYLVNMVATIPMWLAMEIQQDELDIAPKEGSNMTQERLDSADDLIKALDDSAEKARAAIDGTTDEHLMTNWKLLAGGNVVLEAPRYEMFQDTIHHWVHHRGQMTVYYRLMGVKVPAIYGPSADDKEFR
jgi:uncharacterized damage-inducible protein DinB